MRRARRRAGGAPDARRARRETTTGGRLDVAAQTLNVDPVILVLAVVYTLADLALKVVALVSLIPRPSEAIRWRNRWVWLAVIVLVNLLGPLLYLAIGRTEAPIGDAEAAARPRRPAAERARAAVELLYGPSPEERP
jgi:hypothetical protein